ncbi:MAG: right-handed parallel beta-helix repeat-containing protein, partial [Clostridia bacterium]|nr:right-handed parallel beta-helix repeat-containing protein [Clostridia bacterium]
NLYPDGSDQLIRSGITEDANHIRIYNGVYNRRVAKYHTTDGLIFYGYIVWGWYKDLITTDGYTVDPETGDYIYYVPHPEEAYGDEGLRYYPEFVGGFAYDFYQMALLNVSEELDAPGEYWIDADTKTFFVYDPSGDYHFTGGGVMITMGKTEYISLVGLDFINSTDDFIVANDHPRGLTLDRCRFEGCSGENMVRVIATDAGVPLDLLVTRCEFSTCAEVALYVYTVNMEDLFGTGTGAVIDNNYFTLTNLRVGNSSALQAYMTGGRVTHNHFKRCYWKCIGTGYSTNLLVEYNVFDEACCNGDDTGAIGKGTNIWASGTVIRNNLFMNITGGTNGRFGIYLDNAVGAEVYSNLFYNVGVSVMNNDISKYNTFCDNATVKGPAVCDYSTNHTEFVIETVTSGKEDELLNSYSYRRWVEIFAYFDSHPSIKEEAMTYWPELFTFTTDLSRWQEREFCENSSLVITGNRSFNETAKQPEFREIFARYSTIEDNIAYDFGVNPFFVNPTRGDYRIKPDAGFPDIHFEDIGRY